MLAQYGEPMRIFFNLLKMIFPLPLEKQISLEEVNSQFGFDFFATLNTKR